MYSVTVFMSTYNGEMYLEEQIKSILKQKKVKVSLWVRDDGSSDNTINILEKYKKKGKLTYFSGCNLGYGKSFLDLFKNIKIPTDYYAYSDQDDYWEENKLINAINKLESRTSKVGKIYFSDLCVVDKDLRPVGYKKFDNLIISLGSVLVRQRVAGCTMVFDNNLFQKANAIEFDNYEYHISHEWIYILCLALGGEAIYDKHAFIKYRRHDYTVTSLGRGVKSRIKREFTQYKGTKWDKSELCKIILTNYKKHIPHSNLKLIFLVSNYRFSKLSKLKLLFSRDLNAGNLIFNLKTKLFILTNVY